MILCPKCGEEMIGDQIKCMWVEYVCDKCGYSVGASVELDEDRPEPDFDLERISKEGAEK